MDSKLKIQSELNILLNKWDPIGVEPFRGGPKYEYDCFIKPLLKLLESGKTKRGLNSFLREYLQDHMSLDPDNCKVGQFSTKVYNWWINKD